MAYSTISKPSLHFNTVTYTGNGATSTAGTSARTISGVGFQPDFTWVKARTNGGTAYMSHSLHDVVRGVPKTLESNANADEDDVTTGYGSGGIGSFASDGFNIHSGTSGGTNNYNGSGSTYVAWNWKAGGGAGSSNTDGSINTTSTSVNTTAGFSISSYTGTGSNATVGHGLGVAPKMIMIKCRSETQDWFVYHNSIGTNALRLNGAGASEGGVWNSTAPTSSVFSIGTAQAVNKSSGTYVAYCFAEKQGYSKFGSYTGNGNADGAFVYTGFKPAFVIFKVTNDTDNWHMHDDKRTTNGGNPLNKVLYPNLNYSEGSVDIDFLSNGFKPRSNNNAFNASGKPYIYMAFASEPLVANVGQGIPATAR